MDKLRLVKGPCVENQTGPNRSESRPLTGLNKITAMEVTVIKSPVAEAVKSMPCINLFSSYYILFFIFFKLRKSIQHRQRFMGRIDDVLIVGVDKITESYFRVGVLDADRCVNRSEKKIPVGSG